MSFLGKLKQLNEKIVGDGEEIELNLDLSLHGKFGVDKYSNKLIRSTSVANLGSMIPKSDGTLSLLTLVRSSSLPTTESEIPMLSDGNRRRSEIDVGLDLKLNSRGSDESQYGGSGLDYESKPAQGSSSGGQSISPGSNREVGSSKIPGLVKNHFLGPAKNKGEASRLDKMPCVYTKGDGPNGRRVNGILYKYEKGDEVKIMCVCHGSFLSPSEFIKHAGGSDVEHPLKHIVISNDYDAFM